MRQRRRGRPGLDASGHADPPRAALSPLQTPTIDVLLHSAHLVANAAACYDELVGFGAQSGALAKLKRPAHICRCWHDAGSAGLHHNGLCEGPKQSPAVHCTRSTPREMVVDCQPAGSVQFA